MKAGEENLIKIEVDNSHNTNIPPLDADFNFYGGIYRDLELILTEPVHFEAANEAAGNILVKTSEVSGESGLIKVEATIVNHSTKNLRSRVELEILDPSGNTLKVLSQKVSVKSSEKEI